MFVEVLRTSFSGVVAMEEAWLWLEDIPSAALFSPVDIILSLVLAFILGQLIAWVYYATHSGLSYSRSFVQSLIMITVVLAMAMTIIGNNIITAVGLMGALAIVR